MFSLNEIVKDWKESGAFEAHINLYGFWDENMFLTKSGDLGVVLRVKGVDYESLDHASRDYAVKRLEAAFRSFDSRIRIYQGLFKTSDPYIRHDNYANPLVQRAVEQRMAYFASKGDEMYSIDLYWIVLIHGSYVQATFWQAMHKLPNDPAGSLRDIRALLSGDKQRTLLRTLIERDHLLLE